jgi:hypothetical protein
MQSEAAQRPLQAAGVAAAGNEVHDPGGLLAFPRDRAAGPAAAARAHGRDRGDRGPGPLLQLPAQGRHAGPDGHHVAGVSAGDGLRGVALRVQNAGRDDRPGKVSERFQQFPDGRDLIGLPVGGDLAEDRADTVRQGRDQSGLLFPVPGVADGLAVDRDDQPAAGLRRPGVKPGANDLVDLEPAVTAATPAATSPASECRRPRLFRGSGSWASRSRRYWLRAAAVSGEDGMNGRAFPRGRRR